MSGPTTKELAQVTDPLARRVRGMVRRFAIAATAKALWRLTGVRLYAGASEQVEAEVFAGLGVHARPATSGQPEAIVVNVGDARVPVIVATRDEASRRSVADAMGGDIAPGELILYAPAGGAVVHLRADNTVEVRTPGGTATALITLPEGQSLRSWLANHTHTAPSGGGLTSAPSTAPPSLTGTTVIKGE